MKRIVDTEIEFVYGWVVVPYGAGGDPWSFVKPIEKFDEDAVTLTPSQPLVITNQVSYALTTNSKPAKRSQPTIFSGVIEAEQAAIDAIVKGEVPWLTFMVVYYVSKV